MINKKSKLFIVTIINRIQRLLLNIKGTMKITKKYNKKGLIQRKRVRKRLVLEYI